MNFQIRHRVTGEVLFECELSAEAASKSVGVQMGLAIKRALKANASLSSANLRRAGLSSADLRYADLRRAGLSSADLRYANLRYANLRYANLWGANLWGADLWGADLRDADLRDANLRDADLRDANLRDANLWGADLRYADLWYADLRGADLRYADLRDADLRRADLSSADLRGAKGAELAIARTRILPDGQIVGWKKCDLGVIVQLSIPADAKRSHAFGRKCRAEFADVIDIIGAEQAETSAHGPTTIYRVGERVYADSWDDDWTNECSHGIHFYITRAEAEAH